MTSSKLFPDVQFDTVKQIWSTSPFLDMNWLFGFDPEETERHLKDIKPTVFSGLSFKKFCVRKEAGLSHLARIYSVPAEPEKKWVRLEELQLFADYLIEMDRSVFKASKLLGHYKRLREYVIHCPSAELEFDFITSHLFIFPIIKWRRGDGVNENVRTDILELIESMIEKVSQDLRRKHFDANLFEFQNYLIYYYFLAAQSLGTGISAAVVSNHLLVFRLVNSSTWATISPKSRMQYASLVLHLVLQYYSPESEFKPMYGFSSKTLADLRSVLADAAGTSVDAPFTIHQWVFRWFKDKLDADVFSIRRGTDLANLSVLSDGEQSAVIELSRRFASYRLPITAHHLASFLLQFGTTNRIRGALRLLTHIKFFPLWELGGVMERLLASQLDGDPSSRLIVAPLGDQSGSSAIIKYLASHSSLTKRLHFADNIQSALAQTKKGDCLHFVDDCLISGTQTLNILGDLMGSRERKEHHTKHCEALTSADRVEFLNRKKIFHYCVVTDFGKNRFQKNLADTGIDPESAELKFGIVEHASVKAFEPMGPVPWSSIDERTALKQFSTEVGYDILKSRAMRKNWDDARRQESALGFSDFQRLLVFPYNVPKTTLTLLWENGTDSRAWQPLFPGFD